MLRVMVMPGPQGGIQYMLSVEKEVGEYDLVVDTSTIQVLVDSDSAPPAGRPRPLTTWKVL